MKTPEELAKKLGRQWENADLREARVLDEAEAWPVVLAIGKPSPGVVRDEVARVRDHCARWREVKVGEVVWEEARYRATLEGVDYPARWVIRYAGEWVKACGEKQVREEFEKVRGLLEGSEEMFHGVLIRRRSLWREREIGEVERCLKMAAKLGPGCADGLPLRALSAAGNDTKFFERNEGLLVALLDVRFDGEVSRQGLEAFLGANSERGHWLLVVDLEGGLLPFQQVRVRACELWETALPGSHLLVVENESCLHQLPKLKGTVAVLGAGFDLNWMAAPWLKEKVVGYWGDLDTWGLELLGRARGKVNAVEALLMKREIYEEFRTSAVVEEVCAEGLSLVTLTKEERELEQYLRGEERGRLEQEFLPKKVVEEALKTWRGL